MGQIGLDRPPNFGGKRAIIRACEGDESAALRLVHETSDRHATRAVCGLRIVSPPTKRFYEVGNPYKRGGLPKEEHRAAPKVETHP